MANPSMVPPGAGMAGQAMMPGGSGQMHPRVPRPTSQTGLFFSSCQILNVFFLLSFILNNAIMYLLYLYFTLMWQIH